MCGLAAVFKSPDVTCSMADFDRMRDEVAYRGPDDKGTNFFRRRGKSWTPVSPSDQSWEVGLGHRRLSILDLSEAGHQPMRYGHDLWVVYNGEIYNFLELRLELQRQGHRFYSTSDTEVLLAAYAQWGTACFEKFRGMWGVVIFDSKQNEVILCRDRLGIKPLYMWQDSGVVVVASEIKQFLQLPKFVAKLEADVVREYLLTGYEDSHRSFFQHVQPIPPGTWVKIPLKSLKPEAPQNYWFPERINVSVNDPNEAGRLFANKFLESVKLHLRSDVPVGCALSGGLDSSAIASVMHNINKGLTDPLHGFTVTFPGELIDEQEYADVVSQQVGALQHKLTPDPQKFLEEVERFVWVHDEPCGGFSLYAGYCLARLTRQAGIPVLLNGQGGDEVFSGYWQSYFLHLGQLAKQGQFLRLFDHLLGGFVGNGNPSLLKQIPFMLRRYRARNRPEVFGFNKRVFKNSEGNKYSNQLIQKALASDGAAWRLHEIQEMFLPRLLKWEDRNSMAFSVEGRYPFLDHELIELCLSFSPQILYNRGWTKWPLRVGLEKTLPPKVLYRRSKFGFETPQDKWLCGPLRKKLETWLKSDRPAWNYIEPLDVRKLAQKVWRIQGQRGEPGQALLRIFLFDQWLNVFGVRD